MLSKISEDLEVWMRILLIVPCFNEANRIELAVFEREKKKLLALGLTVTFLFANDGSTDETENILKTFISGSKDLLFSAPQNVGKANVIHHAYKSVEGSLKGEFDWIGYWDADLATPIAEVSNMLEYLKLYPTSFQVDSIWGSRIARLGSQIRRQAHRHYLGRIFVTVVSLVLGVKAYDSQCGAKLFRPEAASLAFAEPYISRWIFDVEILLRLKAFSIIEYPLMSWSDIPGSKVKIFREMFRVAGDLVKIKKKYKV